MVIGKEAAVIPADHKREVIMFVAVDWPCSRPGYQVALSKHSLFFFQLCLWSVDNIRVGFSLALFYLLWHMASSLFKVALETSPSLLYLVTLLDCISV